MQPNLMPQIEDTSEELLPGTALLHGQYIIERYLVRGGFGITYLARDSLERRVVIKECFPNAICYRKNGQVTPQRDEAEEQFAAISRHFLREARRLSRMKHPNIVGVHQVFEENNTAYMALDYLDGIDLLMVIEEEPDRLTPDLIRELMVQSLSAVKYIHERGILHRDISPDNFLLDWDNTLTLIDFGAAREHASKAHRALSALLSVKDGYSPQEFYLAGVGQTEASDLYALGATFYHVLTGVAPPHSQERLSAVAGEIGDPYEPLAGRIDGFDDTFLSMIDQALEVFPEHRLQSADLWLKAIATPAAVPAARSISRPGKTAPAEIPDMLSALIADTNRDLQQGQPGDLRQVRRNMKTVSNPLSPQIPKTKPTYPAATQVDIFGNPIKDVQKWLREQDGEDHIETAPVDPKPVKAEATDAQPRKTRRRYSLRSLLGRSAARSPAAKPS